MNESPAATAQGGAVVADQPPAKAIDRTTRGSLWAIAAALAFSSSTVVGKHLLDAYGVASLLWWRFSLATVALWVLLAIRRRRGGPNPLDAPVTRLLGLGVAFAAVVSSGFIALERLDASVYIVIVYVYPVLVVIGSAFLGVRPAKGTWMAFVLVMVGIVLTVPELFSGTGTVSVVGVLLALLQAVLFAGYLIANGKVLARIDGLTNAAWTMLGAAVTMLPFALADGLTPPSTTRIALETLMFALVPTVLATLVMFQAMRDVSAAVVSMIMPLEVVLAMVWSVIFLGDHIRLVQWLGAAVVITAVLLAQWLNARSIATAATPSADMPPEAPPPA